MHFTNIILLFTIVFISCIIGMFLVKNIMEGLEDQSPFSPLFKNTLYINLQEREDRKNHTIEELQKIGIYHAERVDAVKLANGAIGCSLSHIKCIELAKSRNWEYVFICEDDITFLDPDLFMKNFKKFENSEYKKKADVILISGNNYLPYEKITDYYIKISNTNAATGYVVMRHYYDTLLSNFKEGVSKLMEYPTNHAMFAVDTYWKRLQSIDNWYMIIPPTVIQYPNYSNIEKKYTDYTELLNNLDKK